MTQVPPTGQNATSVSAAVAREDGTPTVYRLAGGAKFTIPTPEELFAMGFTWADVVVVPPGSLDRYGAIPAEFTLLRERDQDWVYCVCSIRAVRVPNPDAFSCLGLDWANLAVVPVGGLAANGISVMVLPAPTATATPSSMVFGPNGDCSAPGTRFARAEVPGVTLPNGCHVVQLAGVLWFASANEPLGPDPDFHYHFVPDPDYLQAMGADPGTFVRVGDILGAAHGADQASAVATGQVGFGVEINGMPVDPQGNPAPSRDPKDGSICDPRAPLTPTDWTVVYSKWPLNPLWRGVVWPYPFLDTNQTSLWNGVYVVMSGSLVTDNPHSWGGGGHYAWAVKIWSGGDDAAEADPARWTEMHPPDVIQPAQDPSQRPTSVLAGVVLTLQSTIVDAAPQYTEITTDFVPPGTQPPGTVAAVQEWVGPESDMSTLVEGNPTLTGAQLTNNGHSITVHAKVRAEPFAGKPGKFKGVYKLWWAPAAPDTFPAPALQGMALTDAVTLITSDGLRWDVAQVETGGEHPTVVGQQPPAGTPMHNGDLMQLTVLQPAGPQPGPGPGPGPHPLPK